MPQRPHTARVLLPALILCALGCEDPPIREWRPSDHGQPRSSQVENEPTETAGDPHAGHDHGFGGHSDEDEQMARARAMLRAAQALWRMSCAKCHGEQGEGGGPELAAGSKVADFTDPAWQKSQKDEDIMEVIKEGKGTMPGFGRQLNAHALQSMVVYIRTLGFARQQAAAGGGPGGPRPMPGPPPRATPRPAPDVH